MSYPTERIVALHGNPMWEAIWSVIRTWDIQREPGLGYAGASGDDATAIYDAVVGAGAPGHANLYPSTADALQRDAIGPYPTPAEAVAKLDPESGAPTR